MASDVNEITINYKEDGLLIVKELDRVILSKGAWAAIRFRYQQWEPASNAYGPERYSAATARSRANTSRRRNSIFQAGSRQGRLSRHCRAG